MCGSDGNSGNFTTPSATSSGLSHARLAFTGDGPSPPVKALCPPYVHQEDNEAKLAGTKH